MSLMGYLIIGVFVFLMILRVPIAFSMAISALTYLIIQNLPLDIIAIRMTYAVDSFPLLAVPLFIFAGNLMNVAGITDRIFNFARQIVGHISGSLAHVNIIASLIFAGCSGSSLADVGGLGTMEIKAMDDAGYKRDFSCAVTIASATIGPIFPPSIPLILFAAVTETSALNLLVGGIFPGILLALLLMATVAILAKLHHYPKDTQRPDLRKIGRAFLRALPPILTPVLLIGGMVSGIFSPTEAAAVTVAYGLFLGIFVYREINLRNLYEILKHTMLSTSVIMFVVSAAVLFGWVITVEQIPQIATEMLLQISRNPYVLLLIINLLLLLVGCFIETVAAILLFAPLITKALMEVGLNPTHIGLVFVFNLMIGLITPPVGMSLYLVSNVAKVPVEKVIKATLPFFFPLLLTLLALTYIPQISLLLPNLLK